MHDWSAAGLQLTGLPASRPGPSDRHSDGWPGSAHRIHRSVDATLNRMRRRNRPSDRCASGAPRPMLLPMSIVIDVQHVTKAYGGRRAVDDVSLAIEEGEIFAILGPNGAGKTTLVESIGGLRSIDSGSIAVLGLDPRHDRAALRRVVGIQLQQSELPEQIRVGEAVDLYASFYPTPADGRQLLDELGLGDRRGARYKTLSGGQKQRLSIALALIGNPKVAILDELTTGLDPQARRDTWGLIEEIRGRGVTVILVTHFMEEAERLADRIALIDDGSLVALDTPEGIVRRVDGQQTLRFRPSTTTCSRSAASTSHRSRSRRR